jgi:hypothetical protein
VAEGSSGKLTCAFYATSYQHFLNTPSPLEYYSGFQNVDIFFALLFQHFAEERDTDRHHMQGSNNLSCFYFFALTE